MDELPLSGGNVTAGIVRVGDTVRRPTGHWTPAVHSLLHHLEHKGFTGAPRALGMDAQGREILSFAEGAAAWPWGAFRPLATDEGLLRVAERIGAYHAAVADFRPPPDAVWSAIAPTRDAADTLCHNDFAPWNLVIGPTGELTFIDWDLAAPGQRLSDLAYAARAFVPLIPNPPYDIPIVPRLALLRDSWGLTAAELIDWIVWRARADLAGLAGRAEAGIEPWRTMWNAGHDAGNTEITRFIEASAAGWVAALR
ncbi:MAG TPA: phosphotransferase [Caulobacteraceae bacterium]|nr:phosphotransferase [Caulobacteraceae bacterium]